MTALNLDCWEVVFNHLESETRTLYNCLFVSKQFFHLSAPVLYRQPCEVFKNQTKFSSFSTTKLAQLLELCSGFTTPICSIAAQEIRYQTQKQDQQQFLQQQNFLWAEQRRTRKKKNFNQQSPPPRPHQQQQAKPWRALKWFSIDTTNQPICLPTTINYLELVKLYPKVVDAQDGYARWQHYLNCFAEVMPILYIDSRDAEFVLPLVSRFKSLQTLHIQPISPFWSRNRFSTPNKRIDQEKITQAGKIDMDRVYLECMIKFLKHHSQFFPGLLKNCVLHDTNRPNYWQELVTMTEAIGGWEDQTIKIQQDLAQYDLEKLVVTRLKTLTLSYFIGNNPTIQNQVMEFLKRCRSLETLELYLSKNATLDWNLLFEKVKGKSDHQDQDICLAIGIKHLVFWEINPVTIQAIQTFHNTLESIVVYDQHESSDRPPILDWISDIRFPKLKSLDLKRCTLKIESLSGCPVLETLILTSTPQLPIRKKSWPMVLSIALRKLDLTGTSPTHFDMMLLKPLRNLEFLKLHDSPTIQQGNDLTMINMSIGSGWIFPKLKHVTLAGRFAIQIQGQILWAAPKLEYLSLCLFLNRFQCPLDTDTFLYPPWQLNFDGVQQVVDDNQTGDLITVTKTVPLVSDPIEVATFPSLIHLKLRLFHTPKFETGEAFGNAFFGRQAVDGQENRNDGSTALDSKLINSMDGKNLQTTNPLLFPNLEHLCLSSHRVKELEFFQPVVLVALRNSPKLELIQYLGQPHHAPHEFLDPWLEPVPLNQLGKYHRNRPLVVHGKGIGEVLEGNDENDIVDDYDDGEQKRSRCVVEFDQDWQHRYRLRSSPKQSVGKGAITTVTTMWKQMFSR